jgi:hypothetical protein
MEVTVIFIRLHVLSFKHVTDFYETSHGKNPPRVTGQNSFLCSESSDPAVDHNQKQFIMQKGVHYRTCISLERTSCVLIYLLYGLCSMKYGNNIVDNVKTPVYVSTVRGRIEHGVLCTVFSIPLIGFVKGS